jgi:hypothetical protein
MSITFTSGSSGKDSKIEAKGAVLRRNTDLDRKMAFELKLNGTLGNGSRCASRFVSATFAVRSIGPSLGPMLE